MRRLYLLALVLLCLSSFGTAQELQPYGYYLDAVRFSQTGPGGTTRIQSMAGVQTALGGDLSSAASNPAGLGLYTKSDLSISPWVSIQNSSASYYGNTSGDDLTQFSIGQLGVALQTNNERPGSFLSGTFAITMQRINDFNSNYLIRGTNDDTSIIDSFIEQADGATTAQFGGNDIPSLGYYNYLLGPKSILIPPGPDTEYFTDITGIPFQADAIQTSGKQQQWSISYGGNFSDKVYLGLGLGIVALNYKMVRTYSEDYEVDPLFYLDLIETLSINGTGVNGTLGIIYRPSNNLRVGFSFISPTLYGLEDTYDATMEASWNNFYYEDAIDGDTLLNFTYAETDIITSTYQLTTPLKLNGGVSYFFGKKGFISLDVNYSNYANASLKTNDFSMADDNQVIKEIGESRLDVRVGGEVRIQRLMIRAGYFHAGTSPESEESFYKNGNGYTAGLGLRIKAFYSDLGFTYTKSKQDYVPYYVSGLTPVANVENNIARVMLTMGVNF